MLQIVNRSPLEAGLSLFTDPQGRDVVSVAAKGTFQIPTPGRELILAEEQVPLRRADGPLNEADGLSAYPADLVLGKVASDIGLDGSAYSPDGRLADRIPVRISVGHFSKTAIARSDAPSASMPVRSFLFASPADERRRRYVGTYDAKWQEEHFPLLPKDFDLRFFNAAAPELTAEGYLQGGEHVSLVNLSPRRNIEFSLPALNVWLRFREADAGVTRKADIWNVVFEPDRDRFCVSWGCVHQLGKRPARMREVEIRVTGDTAVLRSSAGPAPQVARQAS